MWGADCCEITSDELRVSRVSGAHAQEQSNRRDQLLQRIGDLGHYSCHPLLPAGHGRDQSSLDESILVLEVLVDGADRDLGRVSELIDGGVGAMLGEHCLRSLQ